MAYRFDSPEIVPQPVANTDTVLNHSYGKIVRARDSTFGEGEFIYLQGCVGTVVGMLVTYNPQTGVTALNPTTVRTGDPVAVAMSACNLTTLNGWYQIGGAAVILKTAVKFDPAVNTKVFQSATIGRIMQTSAAGLQLLGARFLALVTVTSTTSTAVIQIDRPEMMGAIT